MAEADELSELGNLGDLGDLDGDGVPNAWDDDRDGDRVTNTADALSMDASEWRDTDSDNIGDKWDAFPDDPKYYLDVDGDNVDDHMEVDSDNDGIIHEQGKDKWYSGYGLTKGG